MKMFIYLSCLNEFIANEAMQAQVSCLFPEQVVAWRDRGRSIKAGPRGQL